MIDFQRDRTIDWLWTTFGEVNPHILEDIEERSLRFGEESLELIQSLGTTKEQALALVEQVFAKPVGEPHQELGGTLVTLAALCAVAPRLDPDRAFNEEFDRVEVPEMQEKIRQKHKTKAVVSGRFTPVTGEYYILTNPADESSAAAYFWRL